MLVKKGWFKVTVLGVFLAALLLNAFMIAPAAHAKGGDATRIALKGSAPYATAKGTAKYKAEGGEREFQVELENARSLAGKTLNVFVNGAKVGSFRVSALGAGRLERNSDLGQAVPNISAGSRVQIKTTTGALVVSGSF
ncbi:hypothetical protein [Promineifilum sp.]|uniref:hypothetical protein n=1 Tax=Promineifilum sp. TaxID=2664178 RepID=UPI0035B00F42